MFSPWPKIQQFSTVSEIVSARRDLGRSIAYGAKIKLHGTNAGIQIRNGGKDVLAQSRTGIITPGTDNFGFAQWVDQTRPFWSDLGAIFPEKITVFGEWCGNEIHPEAIINKLPERIFAIFAIKIGNNRFIIDDDMIGYMLSMSQKMEKPNNVWFDLWHRAPEFLPQYINFDDPEQDLSLIETEVNKIGVIDPWVSRKFGLRGAGEGLVWYPVGLADHNGDLTSDVMETFLFKTKAQQFKETAETPLISATPVISANVQDFVRLFVTDARCEKIAAEINQGVLDYKNNLLGPFVGSLANDVSRESKYEMSKSDLTWRDVSEAVKSASKDWYIQRLEAQRYNVS